MNEVTKQNLINAGVVAAFSIPLGILSGGVIGILSQDIGLAILAGLIAILAPAAESCVRGESFEGPIEHASLMAFAAVVLAVSVLMSVVVILATVEAFLA